MLTEKETFSNLVILKSIKKSNEKSRNLKKLFQSKMTLVTKIFEMINKLLSVKNPKNKWKVLKKKKEKNVFKMKQFC